MGAPRSGTYLLLTRLSDGFDIAFPVETHFIPLFNRYLFLWGDLSRIQNRRKLLLAIYQFLEIWTPRSERGRDYTKIKAASLLATREDYDSIINNSSNYGEIVHGLFGSFARLQGKSNYGDKSAFYSHIPLETLCQTTEQIKVVHIVRDGRDVSLSWRKIFTGPETLIDSATQWATHVTLKHAWGNRNPSRYLKISYEDLITNESSVTEAVAEFASLSKKENLVGSQKSLASVLAKGDMHTKIGGPIITNNKNIWKTNMTERDIRIFEYFAGPALLEMGYSLSGKQPNILELAWFRQLYLYSKMRKLFSIRFWRLKVKNSLPLAIWLSGQLNISLAKILNRNKFERR